ncbi:DUF3221 domain-containing protein [Paenibacillus sp. 598K]|uniref:DUF3221 domain-containing protein n=1 Tax=Paenibacillus sp. 598K TaxID=1117987 RepID=UPI000FF98466|nr:DUF3221 domain-containing protein [Paenibacillus sp. 598K]GBF77415.1 DUF3221 domain-containing protein [Paenibacillus sp. 598K]
MKQAIIGLLLVWLIAGCSVAAPSEPDPEPEEPFFGIKGTVVSEEGERVLIVSDTVRLGAAGDGQYDAAWFSGVKGEVEIGERVEMGYDGGVDQSYPAQAKGKLLRKLPDERPSGATLSRAEVVRQALRQTEAGMPAVVEVSYSKSERQWRIDLYNNGALDGSTLQVLVKDEPVR